MLPASLQHFVNGHCIVDMFAGDYMVVSVSCNPRTFKWDIPEAEVTGGTHFKLE